MEYIENIEKLYIKEVELTQNLNVNLKNHNQKLQTQLLQMNSEKKEFMVQINSIKEKFDKKSREVLKLKKEKEDNERGFNLQVFDLKKLLEESD